MTETDKNPRQIKHRRGFARLCALFVAAALGLASPAQSQDSPLDAAENFDHWMDSYRSQGLRIDRLSAAWQSKIGTFRVGNDAGDFPQFARASAGERDARERPEPARLSWSGNGFSIAVQEAQAAPKAVNESHEPVSGLTEGSPNLILSWQGGFAEQGRYKMSALGRRLAVRGVHEGVDVKSEELGWGVQLSGGWGVSDLFAALRVTLGEGIDSLLLNRFGSDATISDLGKTETVTSLSISPSLNYHINERSDFLFSVGRHHASGEQNEKDGDTLDTINLRYNWSPWPTARIGVQLGKREFEGAIGDSESREIKIGVEAGF